MQAPKHILIRGPNFLGDHLMAWPFYRAVREQFPLAKIALLTTSALAGFPHEKLFDEVIALDSRRRKTVRGIFGYARQLQAKKFDVAYNLPASFSSAVLLKLAGIPARIGFGPGWLLTRGRRWRGAEAKLHKSDLYLELLASCSFTSINPPVARKSRDQKIVIAPEASRELREWPYFRELIGRLRREIPEFGIVLVGSAENSPWREWVSQGNDPGIENCIGKTDLPGVIDLLGSAHLVVANDSGLAHVAATWCDTPTVVLMGPGTPHYIAPRGRSVRVIRNDALACSPCESTHCRAPYGYKACLTSLGVDRVVEEVRAHLQQTMSLL